MKKNVFIVGFVIALSYQVFAIRHVGNGGGDAEMKILDYFSNIQSWFSYCSIKTVVCIEGVQQSDFQKFSYLFDKNPIQEVKFVKPEDYLKRINYSADGLAQVVYTNDELYIDLKTPKSNSSITAIIFNSMSEIFGINCFALENQIKIRPEIKQHSSFSIYQIKIENGHDLFFRSKSGHFVKAIPEKYSDLSKFVILTQSKTGFFVKSLISGVIYELVFSPDSNGYQIKVFVQSDF